MKLLTHPLVTAVALSMFCSLSLVAALVSPEHIWVYHHLGSPISIFGGVLLSFAITWALASIVLWTAESLRKTGRFPFGLLVFWTAIVALLPFVLIQQSQYMNLWQPSLLFKRTLFAIVVAVSGVWLWHRRHISRASFDRVHGFLTTVLGFAAIGSVMTLVQLGWNFREAVVANHAPVLRTPLRRVSSNGSRHRRVIWILLDELSYDQVYGHRYNDVQLPEFDRLAQQSVVFTDVTPAGLATRIAVPGMIVGKNLDNILSSATGWSLQLMPTGSRSYIPFDPKDTVFGDAVAMGATTGVVGWYNPYCRLLHSVLNRCTSSFNDEFQQDMWPQDSILSNGTASVRGLLAQVEFPRSINQMKYERRVTIEREERIAEYKTLYAASDALLSDNSIDLKFIHMPFPHPPGFYNRKTGQLTTGPATYMDNLAVADQYLQHVRELLTARGEWDADAVLITGDHSWRTTTIWMGLPDWTQEEQQASRGGKFDPRPAWILKLPGQHEPAHIDTLVNAYETRNLLRDLLNGNVKTVSEVAGVTQGTPQHEDEKADAGTQTDLRQPKQIALKSSEKN